MNACVRDKLPFVILDSSLEFYDIVTYTASYEAIFIPYYCFCSPVYNVLDLDAIANMLLLSYI